MLSKSRQLKLAFLSKIINIFTIVLVLFDLASAMPKEVRTVCLPSNTIGTQRFIQIYHYTPASTSSLPTSDPPKHAYIQASLHADELPGLLVAHHLIHMLDDADKRGDIKQEITIVPFANPIGLSQILLGSHIGRFNLDTAINFNRDWPDYTSQVISKLEEGEAAGAPLLKSDDSNHNVKVIRNLLLEACHSDQESGVPKKEDQSLKQILYEIMCACDIVLDLHCDTDAVIHIYTHDRLWPQLSDLSREIQSHAQLLAPSSGGSPFDEAASCPWASIADKFSNKYPIPMACESATIELRGESDVNDSLNKPDAECLFRFLQRRGYIGGKEQSDTETLPALIRDATPLTGVDMIVAEKPGVVSWKVKPGDFVLEGQVLGEIVNIEDPYATRTPVRSKTSGLVFGIRRHKLVVPGQIIIKVSGEHPLSYRQGGGNLLTSR